MTLIAKDSKPEKEKPTTGMQHAVLAFVEDLGDQKVVWNGKEKTQRKIVFCWELEEKMSGIYQPDLEGKPFMVSQRYTLSLNEKSALTKTLENWFGKKIDDNRRKAGIDLETLIGKTATLNLAESDNGQYINIQSVNPPMPGATDLKIFNQKPPPWIEELRAKAVKKDEGVSQEEADERLAEADEASNEKIPF